MSRIGKLPIALPDKVSVSLDDGVVSVKGPKGELTQAVPEGVSLEVADGNVTLGRPDDSRGARADHGLARSLVANMVEGVANGYTKTLVINGVGYKAESKGKNWIMFSLGYSHPILYELPDGVDVEIDGKAKEPSVKLSGCDKQVIGAVAAEIRSLRPPEPYKGKGIRYSDEQIRRKEGKAAGK